MDSILYVEKITLDDKNINKDVYPYCIPVLKNFKELTFEEPVSFFIGENGSGKSTLLEAIAVKMDINPEGGSKNFMFKTNDTHSELYQNIRITKTFKKLSTKYFLRAESFYNVATEVDRLYKEDGNVEAFIAHGGKSLHESSHGESFIQLLGNRFFPNGLYLLDEPEAALSPLKQMQLIVMIDDLVKKGCQFIIATHSPIILAYPKSIIYDFDNNLQKTKYEDTNNYQLYKLFVENKDKMIKELLEKEKEV